LVQHVFRRIKAINELRKEQKLILYQHLRLSTTQTEQYPIFLLPRKTGGMQNRGGNLPPSIRAQNSDFSNGGACTIFG
jgi:hypothetical protein